MGELVLLDARRLREGAVPDYALVVISKRGWETEIQVLGVKDSPQIRRELSDIFMRAADSMRAPQ